MDTQKALAGELRQIFPYAGMNEWLLASKFNEAFSVEDFEACKKIQQEIDARIASDTINHSLMKGFRYYNAESDRFEGPAHISQYNGLFDNYFQSKGIEIA